MRPSPPTLTGKKTTDGKETLSQYSVLSAKNLQTSHIFLHSTIVDLRLNENKIRSIHYSSLSRFGNLTYLNLTKNDISYVEDGAFSAQFNLQVSSDIQYIQYIHAYNKGKNKYVFVFFVNLKPLWKPLAVWQIHI